MPSQIQCKLTINYKYYLYLQISDINWKLDGEMWEQSIGEISISVPIDADKEN